jgi:predicted dehydrogenase
VPGDIRLGRLDGVLQVAGEPDCRVAAGCDPNPAARERFAAQYPEATMFADYEAILTEGLEIVFVVTPMPFHRDKTVAVLKAGCHVL